MPPLEEEEEVGEDWGATLAQAKNTKKKTKENVTVTFPESSTGTACVTKNATCEYDAAGPNKLIYSGANSTLCVMSIGASYGQGWNSSVSAVCEKGSMPP